MKFSRLMTALVMTTSGLLWQGPAALACQLDRPVNFAGLEWGSAAFHNAVARRIVSDGYGCSTRLVSGETLPLFAKMVDGEVDVTMELWKPNLGESWKQASADGRVRQVGVNFDDSSQGWFVPRYLVDGPDAKAPDLRGVKDLARFKHLFADSSSNGKGRFFNCASGWGCEVINSKKLVAYGLDKDFINDRATSGAGMVAAIASRYKRREPFVAYYWTPTWVAGKFDLVMLEEPAYNYDKWMALSVQSAPTEATAYPSVPVGIAVSADFARQAPKLVKFLSRYEMDAIVISEALAYIEDNKVDPDTAAVEFLRLHQDDWQRWVPKDVAKRVLAKL
jgi:glycine betaine/proline transport system substrate-binding protein